MSTAIATETPHMREDESDIWFEPTKLGNEQNVLLKPLSTQEVRVLDPYSALRQLGEKERQRAIDSYWRKNGSIQVGETIINVLLFAMILWTAAFLFSMGLRMVMITAT